MPHTDPDPPFFPFNSFCKYIFDITLENEQFSHFYEQLYTANIVGRTKCMMKKRAKVEEFCHYSEGRSIVRFPAVLRRLVGPGVELPPLLVSSEPGSSSSTPSESG